MSEHDEGRKASADAIRQTHKSGGTPLGNYGLCKLHTGADLTKRRALPPQDDDSEDEEEIGVSGGTGTDIEMEDVPQKRKRRAARGMVADANQARRMRADRDDEDLDDEEDDMDDDDDSWPPPRGKARSDRDESGRFKARSDEDVALRAQRKRRADLAHERKSLKVFKGIGARPTPLGFDEALSLRKLAAIPNTSDARQRDLLRKMDDATDTLRKGGRIDAHEAYELARAIAAVRR
jgi:hypothetical protein